MVTITLYARQQRRHTCIEQSFGFCGRGRGLDDLGEWHWNMYIIICEMNRQSRFNAWYKMLSAGALGWLRGIVWGGKREGGSGWGRGKNTSDKMTLIPSSFSCVLVPVCFCNWDRLIPSGEGGYPLLILHYWFITKPFISISNRFSQKSSFWVRSQRLSQDIYHILPSKVIKQSNTFKSSNIFFLGPLNSLPDPPWFFVFLDKKKVY